MKKNFNIFIVCKIYVENFFMPKTICVSVIIPVYNSEKYLEQCLDSVLEQSLKEIEIIVVNDGSTDKSPQILDEYKKKDERLIVVHKQNEGVSVARNQAISIAKGKYISFVDSDDWLRADALEKLYAKAEKDKLEMLCLSAKTLYMNTGNYYDEALYNFKYFPKDYEPGIFSFNPQESLWWKITPAMAMTFYQRKFIKNNKLCFLKNYRYEDCLFFKQAFFKAKRIAITREQLYFRRRHDESMVASKGKSLMDYMRINDIIYKLAAENGVSADELNAFISSTFSYIIVLFKQIDKKYRQEYFLMMKDYFNKYCSKNVLRIKTAYKNRKEIKDILKSDTLFAYYLRSSWRKFKKNIFGKQRKNNKLKLCILGIKFSFAISGVGLMKYVRLNTGNMLPLLGFGTFPMKGKILKKAVKVGKKIGFRLFDTATAYQNEKDLGKALWGKYSLFKFIKRPHYFITTKLFLDDCRKHTERQALLTSMEKLGVSYVDLYLMHWADPDCFVDNWKEMEKLYKEGLAKNIGVCNFEIHHLQRLLDECEIVPAVNQVECHPLLTQKPLLQFCQEHGIIVQSYSPFARMDDKLVKNPLLLELADKYKKTVTQIILKWNIQQGRCVIPKSANPERLKENFNIFDFYLSREDLSAIDELNQDYRIRFHPDVYPIVNYPNKYKDIKNENLEPNKK